MFGKISKLVNLFILYIFFSTGVSFSGDKGSNCPPGNISMQFNSIDCTEGNYYCVLYVQGNVAPIGGGYLTYPTSIKYTASGNFCTGFYRWEVTGPVNFETCWTWYNPYVNNELTITTDCDGCDYDNPTN